MQAPCRLGERFRVKKAWMFKGNPVTLTGLDLFKWSSSTMPDTTFCFKRDPRNEREHTGFCHPNDLATGVNIELELDDAAIEPGYPLRKLGMDTDAVGHLSGVLLTEDGWAFKISRGRHYGEPLEYVRTEVLDRLFAPVLPQKIHVDAMTFLTEV
ncbi:MAG: hypothetical protein MJ074_06830 [Oscillospiraceae bacterium]|nr:hypothetical protein [Oscillospiraceae bacterium]